MRSNFFSVKVIPLISFPRPFCMYYLVQYKFSWTFFQNSSLYIQERSATYFTLYLCFEKPVTPDNLHQTATKSQTKKANDIWIFKEVHLYVSIKTIMKRFPLNHICLSWWDIDGSKRYTLYILEFGILWQFDSNGQNFLLKNFYLTYPSYFNPLFFNVHLINP